ncbi:MAG: insulinase family protein, partial [Mucilaginibacter polytrichastri]|nr:insulinase family protein [Mucilaginibacter polytrichastri]
MQPDRTLAPLSREIGHIPLIEPEKLTLNNGVPLYVINAGDQELVRIEFIFPHVSWNSSKPLQSTATLSLLNEGTSQFSSEELAENLDYYGAFLQTDFTFDHATVALYTLNKHISSVLPYLKALLTDAVFPEKELSIYRTNQKEKYKINFQKNEFLTRKRFNGLLFGDTLYGHEVSPDDFENLSREDLRAYFAAAFHPQLATVIISGKVSNNIIEEV